MGLRINGGDGEIVIHISRGARERRTHRNALVVCHGFPCGPGGAATSSHTYPELADRLATESGWTVATFDFRATGESGGTFSLPGWVSDAHAVAAHLCKAEGVRDVWLAGFSEGGAVALVAAAEDDAIRGVAAFAAPADFAHWVAEPAEFIERATELGMVSPDIDDQARLALTAGLDEVRPLGVIAKIPPRPILLVYGSDDREVTLLDGRALMDAAEGHAELRVLTGAEHQLRHDPRAIAMLIGWMYRQVQ